MFYVSWLNMHYCAWWRVKSWGSFQTPRKVLLLVVLYVSLFFSILTTDEFNSNSSRDHAHRPFGDTTTNDDSHSNYSMIILRTRVAADFPSWPAAKPLPETTCSECTRAIGLHLYAKHCTSLPKEIFVDQILDQWVKIFVSLPMKMEIIMVATIGSTSLTARRCWLAFSIRTTKTLVHDDKDDTNWSILHLSPSPIE